MADLFDILLAKNLAGGGGGGGGDSAIVYTSIIDNGDNTITATDDKGVEHIVSYVVGADDKITSITLDGKTQSVTYEGDVLVKIGNTDVNMESVPIYRDKTVEVFSQIEVVPPVQINSNADMDAVLINADTTITL